MPRLLSWAHSLLFGRPRPSTPKHLPLIASLNLGRSFNSPAPAPKELAFQFGDTWLMVPAVDEFVCSGKCPQHLCDLFSVAGPLCRVKLQKHLGEEILRVIATQKTSTELAR